MGLHLTEDKRRDAVSDLAALACVWEARASRAERALLRRRAGRAVLFALGMLAGGATLALGRLVGAAL